MANKGPGFLLYKGVELQRNQKAERQKIWQRNQTQWPQFETCPEITFHKDLILDYTNLIFLMAVLTALTGNF